MKTEGPANSQSRVGFWRLAVYASPALVTSLAWMPLGFVVVKFYAKYTSLSLTTIGAVILVARIFDAVSDPLIAYLSDRIDTRWGRRKPWIVLSAPLVATGFALMFLPAPDIHWTYFLVANIVLYSGWTFFEITHISWGIELERDRHRRSQIGVLLKVFGYAGSLLFFAFPFLFNPDSTEFTRPVMNALGIFITAMFPVLALIAVSAVPRERRLGSQPFVARAAVREVIQNRLFRTYAGAFVLWAIADAVIVALFVIYVDVRLDLSALEGVILLAAYLSRVVGAPIALAFLKRFDRKTLWCGAALGNALVMPTVLMIPAGPSAGALIIAFAVVLGLFDCLIGILAITILGDVVDYDAVSTGRDKAASYKASINLIEKGARATATSAALMIVGVAGLEVGADNSDMAVSVLSILYAVVPAALNLLSATVMRSYTAHPASIGAKDIQPERAG